MTDDTMSVQALLGKRVEVRCFAITHYLTGEQKRTESQLGHLRVP